jgi:fructose-1,6-bisphosphatase/inositol monophosphatase family enzyme
MSIPQVGSQHLERMERAALTAAQHMAHFFAEKRSIKHEYKHDESIVMNLDLQSQELILKELGQVLPIVAEENPDSHTLIDQVSEYFLVDPLDGTASAKRFQGIQGGQIGFGPLIGLVLGGRLAAAVFVSLPLNTIFTATSGGGTYRQVIDLRQKGSLKRVQDRELLTPRIPESLRECGVLFFPGAHGEVPLVAKLRTGNVVENMYRFGGFASDCARLAAGYEQIQIQFSVKAWDFSATLFAREVGLQILCDPLGKKIYFDDWKIALENPLISCPAGLFPGLLEAIS